MSDQDASGPGNVDEEVFLAFARNFQYIADNLRRLQAPEESEVRDLVAEHVGSEPADLIPVGEDVPSVDKPNFQLAMDRLVGDDPDSTIIGLSPEVSHFSEFSFSALLAGRFYGPGRPQPPVYRAHPVAPNKTLRCLVNGIWLLHFEDHPVVVCMAGREHGHPFGSGQGTAIEVFSISEEVSAAVLERIGQLRHDLNVYRGQVLAFAFDEYGGSGLTFWERPSTTANDVILPPGVLESISRHAIGIGQQADRLLAAGQHLKRGLLLYGPPGTGKTHTVNYLLNAMPDRTAVVLQGSSVGALGYAAAIVRSLSPAMLVIEDIDIIATERGHYGEPGHPLLFNLLNEMDGLNPTDDVLFVLTTNHPQILEPALKARPGRIDHAVEIPLPGDTERRQLLLHYLGSSATGLSNIGHVVERTEGVTASFTKELVRRANLAAIERSPDAETAISDHDMTVALDELLESASDVAQAAFGLGADTPNEQMFHGPSEHF